MAFITDKQTLDDLNIFGRHSHDKSIYTLFNRTSTRGGAKVLEDIFKMPFSDAEKINERSAVIKYFQASGTAFPFKAETFDTIDYYLNNKDTRSRLSEADNTMVRKMRGYLGADNEYEQIHSGVLAVMGLLRGVADFVQEHTGSGEETPYARELTAMTTIIADRAFAEIISEKERKKLPYSKTAAYDNLLRYKMHEKIKKLLYYIYNLDAYISVAAVATMRGFVFATALEPEAKTLSVEGIYHPQIDNPVANSLTVDEKSNVLFLTGANMGGKSTLMKTIGITIYLAHMGFPVPARSMTFSVKNGLLTTINLPDNLSMGYSHFYAEVLRVKKVSKLVNNPGNLLIIFDELFRGTNVQDAYDATVAITEAFAQKKDCVFIISTHIIEAGEDLGKRCDNIMFVYLPTIMNGKIPTYTYTLTSGITTDRHGMMIINNEGIIETIESNLTN